MPKPPAMRSALAALALLMLLAVAPAPWAGAAPTISGTRAEVEALGREVAELDVRVGQAAQAANLATDRLEAAQQALATTRRELSGARKDLDKSHDLLAERLIGLYVNGEPSFTALLLTSGSLTDAQETAGLLGQIARRDASTVATVRERRARLAELERGQVDAETSRRRELEVTRARRDELGALVAEQRDALAGARARLTRLVKEEKERKRRLAALEKARQAALSSIPVAGATALTGALPAGDYVFPVTGQATFTNDWLYPRAGGRYHQGIDIFATRGTPLIAVADGSLYNVGYNGLGGWRLWLRDRSGNTFYYAHLSAYAPAASEGASVARGTVIGYVGDTGDARGTSPHLHFEIHPGGGGPVPPYPIVTGWPRAS